MSGFCRSLHSADHKLEVVVGGLRVAILARLKPNNALVVFEHGLMRLLTLEFPARFEQLQPVLVVKLNAHQLSIQRVIPQDRAFNGFAHWAYSNLCQLTVRLGRAFSPIAQNEIVLYVGLCV